MTICFRFRPVFFLDFSIFFEFTPISHFTFLSSVPTWYVTKILKYVLGTTICDTESQFVVCPPVCFVVVLIRVVPFFSRGSREPRAHSAGPYGKLVTFNHLFPGPSTSTALRSAPMRETQPSLFQEALPLCMTNACAGCVRGLIYGRGDIVRAARSLVLFFFFFFVHQYVCFCFVLFFSLFVCVCLPPLLAGAVCCLNNATRPTPLLLVSRFRIEDVTASLPLRVWSLTCPLPVASQSPGPDLSCLLSTDISLLVRSQPCV